MKRRTFFKSAGLIGLVSSMSSKTQLFSKSMLLSPKYNSKNTNKINSPIVISTWKHGVAANIEAIEIINQNKSALDAVENGVRVSESDPKVTSVGYGGKPDRDGNVTLDACIMDSEGNCGSVAFIQEIKNPISVARKVMEKTKHIMLVGEGALKFALKHGFKKENLLTEESKKYWEEWKKTGNYDYNLINIENHDTIGMLAIDKKNHIAGACTTSGLSGKIHGRVGDSPIIGAGMYCDDEVGGACATGVGEAVIRVCGSFMIVELMRNGMSPQQACEEGIKRVVKKYPDFKKIQVGFLAINKSGDYGAYSIQPGFEYALTNNSITELFKSDSLIKV